MKKNYNYLHSICTLFILLAATARAQEAYTVEAIPFQSYPTDMVELFADDDEFSGIIDIPFDFEFFGETYGECLVSTNGTISFDTQYANQPAPWLFDDPVPSTSLDVTLRNSILGCFHDMNSSVEGSEGTITYMSMGLPPYRQFVVMFNEQPHFGCDDLNITSSFQIILHETYNYIDVQIINKDLCTSWNDGRAVIGIMDGTGTVGYTPPGRNTGAWEASNEGWRFIPPVSIEYDYTKCDGDANGFETFDFAVMQAGIDPFAVFYLTEEDAEGAVNALTGSGFTNPTAFSPATIYAAFDNTIMPINLNIIDCANDSDDDSVPTEVEDVNGDGNLDNDDTDSDGIPDYLDNDDDGDWVPTSEEYVFGSLPWGMDNDNNPIDSDGDGIPNYLDNDDDGDGLLTMDEDYNGNSDLIDDDADSDITPDFLDNDDDNDGVLTVNEYFNGYIEDSDQDGINNHLDADDDGDNMLTANEDLDLDGDIFNDDSNGNGVPNYLDNDDDGDGYMTINEEGDTDNDMVPNYLDNDDDGDNIITLNEEDTDTDNDMVPDYLDNDDDGDGYPTINEEGDTDNDMVSNYLDNDDDGDGYMTINEEGDTDNDMVPDYLDNDDDGDGYLTIDEEGDTDNDMVPNYLDNDDDGDNIITLNEEDADTDNDMVPDYLDNDDDGDTVLTVDEIFGNNAADTDQDGIANHVDTDDDGDGLLTANEDINGDGNPLNDDTDSNNIPNYLDNDDDGDGVLTIDEDYNQNGDPSDDDLNANSTPDYLEDTTAGITDALYSNITLYPNPATNVLNIQNGTSKEISDISIYAINGVLVKQASNTGTVNIADMQDGVYIVKVRVDEQVLNYRLIKK